MTIDDLKEIVRDGLERSLEIASVSRAADEEGNEIYLGAVDGEDFVITIEAI